MADRYWRGTTNSDWGNINNWSATSGGATGVSVPTSADDVYFDGNGNNNCNTTTTNRRCSTLTFSSAFTAIFNFGGTLSIDLAATFHPNTNYTSSGTPTLDTSQITGTKIITSNEAVLPVNLYLATTAYTITLADTMRITRNLIMGNNGNQQVINGADLYVGGSCAITATYGTSRIILNGTGTIGATTFFDNDLVIDTAGTITFNPLFIKRNGLLKYNSGTVVTTGSTLRLANSGGISTTAATLDTFGIVWNVVNFNYGLSTNTITFNSKLVTSSIILSTFNSPTVNFVGSFGFETNSLSYDTPNNNTKWNFAGGVEYLIKTAFTVITATSANRPTFNSASALNRAKITLSPAASQDLGFINFTNIDASDGQTIWVWKPVITNSQNVKTLTVPKTVASVW